MITARARPNCSDCPLRDWFLKRAYRTN
ncbi:hypothetical protein EXE43_01825 [Halorubrum sp. SS5]|nr:hypothetical protein EXE43_01825 [Halorubrum sp. SS5]